MWSEETSLGFESRKCRDRVVQYLHGTILDIGCGEEKVIPQAIGVDLNEKADIRVDLTNPHALRLFNDNAVNVVFSSHFLEHVYDYETMLREMWRVIRPKGLLILYLPHKDLYPNIGQPGANPDHKHDFVPEDILRALDKFAKYSVIRNQTYSGTNEYSFELIIEKSETPSIVEPDTRDRILVIRLGAYGDMVQVTPIFRLYHEKGYKVDCLCNHESFDVLEHNPYIEDLQVIQRGAIPATQLKEYFAYLGTKYAKVINLCESIERGLLLEDRDEEFYLPKEERHKRCNVNYSDRLMELAGLDERGLRPEIYLSEQEEFYGNLLRKKNAGWFCVQWQLTGSSTHKLYPYAEAIIEYCLDKYPRMKFYLTGGPEVHMYVDSWDRRVVSKLGKWNQRQSIVMTKFMDLVVSPETGTLNGAGAFPVPKIGLLTHSSRENLTKYFLNDYSLESEAKCAPCHRLVHDVRFCETDKTFGLPVCMSEGHSPARIIGIIDRLYREWLDANYEERRESAQAA